MNSQDRKTRISERLERLKARLEKEGIGVAELNYNENNIREITQHSAALRDALFNRKKKVKVKGYSTKNGTAKTTGPGLSSNLTQDRGGNDIGHN
jgi:hypothetical protein